MLSIIPSGTQHEKGRPCCTIRCNLKRAILPSQQAGLFSFKLLLGDFTCLEALLQGMELLVDLGVAGKWAAPGVELDPPVEQLRAEGLCGTLPFPAHLLDGLTL